MSNSYARFMNGDMPFWDFVAEMGGNQAHAFAGAPGDRWGGPRGFPPGPHGPPGAPGASGDNSGAWAGRSGFFPGHPATFPGGPQAWGGWSPFDGPAGNPWAHGFAHRPHPRHHGRRGHHGPHEHSHDHTHEHSFGRHRTEAEGNENPAAANRDEDEQEETLMTPATEGTITMQDNEKKMTDDDVPDPEISTPNEKDDEGSSDSSSDSEDDDHDCTRCQRRRERRGGRHGRRGGRGGRGGMPGHFHGPGEHRRGPLGRGPMPPGGGPFDGFGRRGRHGLFGGGPRGGHFGGGRHRGPGPNNGAPNFSDLMHAFSNDPRLRSLGDAVGNVFRATGAMINPDSAQETGVTNNDRSGEPGTNMNLSADNNNPDVDFRPKTDVYDTPDTYVVHIMLPGAKKEDVHLNWDADMAELHVAGVVVRDGDEKLLQSLAQAERDVGVFERRVKLGPEKVDGDAIKAKMQDGILVIHVAKLPVEEAWTDVRRVEIS